MELSEEGLLQVLLKLKDLDFAFSLVQDEITYYVVHIFFPDPEDKVTVSMVVPDDEKPLIIATLQEGWVDEETVRKEIRKAFQ